MVPGLVRALVVPPLPGRQYQVFAAGEEVGGGVARPIGRTGPISPMGPIGQCTPHHPTTLSPTIISFPYGPGGPPVSPATNPPVRVGFLGAGQMATALARGWLTPAPVAPPASKPRPPLPEPPPRS